MGFGNTTTKEDVRPIYVGGFIGISKKTGNPFYCLQFVVSSEKNSENKIGTWQNVNLFVKQEVYQQFELAGLKSLDHINANIMFVNGGFALINYTL